MHHVLKFMAERRQVELGSRTVFLFVHIYVKHLPFIAEGIDNIRIFVRGGIVAPHARDAGIEHRNPWVIVNAWTQFFPVIPPNLGVDYFLEFADGPVYSGLRKV